MSTRRRDGKRTRGGDPKSLHRRRVRAVCDTLGLRGAFEAMPADLRDQVARDFGTEPRLAFAASFPADPAWRAALREAFSAASCEDDSGRSVRVVDGFAVLPGLASFARNSRGMPGLPRACERFFADVVPAADAWLSRQAAAWDALHEAVIVPLVARGRVDDRLFHATLTSDTLANGSGRVRMTLHAAVQQADRVTLDGEPRRAFRVGTGNAWDAVEWAAWPASASGRPGDGGRGDGLPVYAQSHALRQLRSRVDLADFAPYLDHWLHASLAAPVVTSRQAGGDLLVEFRVGDDRLGYLVVTPLADRVVVRTFLFLTMTPSPEAALLNQRLRLSRDDLNWLRLDRLSAFAGTDLRDDAALRSMLGDCGCGHLFDLDSSDVTPRPLAADVRRHLGVAA